MKAFPLVWGLLVWGLLAVALGSLLGCGVTLQELQARNPNAKTLQVHCRPWKIPDNVKLFAARSSGEHVHTDEAPGALRDFAEHAGVFIEINASAPHENARQDLLTDQLERASRFAEESD